MSIEIIKKELDRAIISRREYKEQMANQPRKRNPYIPPTKEEIERERVRRGKASKKLSTLYPDHRPYKPIIRDDCVDIHYGGSHTFLMDIDALMEELIRLNKLNLETQCPIRTQAIEKRRKKLCKGLAKQLNMPEESE